MTNPLKNMLGERSHARSVEVAAAQRIRLLYSLGDIQLALSAAAFLAECNPQEKYSTVDLRRFRCYETTMIIAYTRPFTKSRGEIPPLNLKIAGVKLNSEQNALHERLMNLRNRVIAHSDADMMRLVSKSEVMKFEDGFEFTFFQPAFDEGLNFVGMDVIELNELLRLVYNSIYTKLIKEAQAEPDKFNIRKDHLYQ